MSFKRTTGRLSNGEKLVTLPAQPVKAVEEMMEIISDLRAVYEAETKALSDSNIDGFMSLQDQKLSAAKRYEQGIAQMLQRRHEIKTVDEDVKNRLRDMQNSFSTLAFENKKLLEKMQRSTQRLGETIRHTAQKVISSRIATSYSSSGALKPYRKGNMSVGISETA